jgi:hypothetical protein
VCLCYEGQGSITPIIAAAPASNVGVVLERALFIAGAKCASDREVIRACENGLANSCWKNKEKGGKRKRTNFLSLFVYGCFPGGSFPAGFVAGFCVNPPPLHTGCCPPGSLPPPFVQDGSDILAWTGVASDETSIATDSVTAMAASAANVTLFMFTLNIAQRVKTLTYLTDEAQRRGV